MRCRSILALVLGIVASAATPASALGHGAAHAALEEHHHDAALAGSGADVSEQDVEHHSHASSLDSVIRRSWDGMVALPAPRIGVAMAVGSGWPIAEFP